MIEIPSPEQVALARRLYLGKIPVKAILAEAGIKLHTLYRCLSGDFPDGSGIAPAPIALRRAGVRICQRMGSRAALVTRMWKTAERQVEEIEKRLKAAGLELAERESNARTLATVAKTLRELSAFDEASKPGKSKKPTPDDDSDDDPVPRDINDFRRELARRIDALVDRRTDARGAGTAE
jgi:hypothetical protein